MKNKIILEVSNLTVSFGKKIIIEDLSFNVNQGEILGIIGKSGCGKSTLLRTVAGFNESFSGNVIVNKKVHRKPTINVIYLHQDYNQLFPWLNVRKNISFPLKKVKDIDFKVDEILNIVDLKEQEMMCPFELSGGQKQRVALARALILKPDLILMDESFNALDETTRHSLQIATKRIISKTNNTVLFVTHDIDEALFMSNRILVFGKEKNELIGNPSEFSKTDLRNMI